MIILGINHNRHDAAAALLIDGRIAAMAEEERFLRKKHAGDIPVQATRFCLQKAGIMPGDIDHVTFFYNPFLMFFQRWKQFARYFPHSLNLFRREAEAHTRIERMGMFFSEKKLLQRVLFDNDPGCRFKFHYVQHHLTHAASTFFLSPFEEAAILSVDGAGEWATTWLGTGKGNRLTRLQEVNFPHSLGLLYSAVTHYLGFKPWADEGKVMGLASYGGESLVPAFREIIQPRPGGRFVLDMSYFRFHTHGWNNWISEKFLRRFGPPRVPESPLEPRHEDIAYALQKVTEEISLHMVRHLHQLTRQRNLCLVGGVALNCVMNGRVFRQSPFEEVFVQPVANDAGTCLGAALWLHHQKLGNPRKAPMTNAYWGPSFTSEQCLQVLKGSGLAYHQSPNIAAEAAGLLAQGKIIGWFQGAMEAGPRALGNRSILADPRRPEMKDILNHRVKHREGFRPFAPAVLAERAGEYFADAYPSPYMILSFDVLPEKRSVIPAVTHVDGTARVQTVTAIENPIYYRVIAEFERLTGVPVLVNTSFNVRGEPIVCTPEDAINCFVSTDMDVLILEDWVARKPG